MATKPTRRFPNFLFHSTKPPHQTPTPVPTLSTLAIRNPTTIVPFSPPALKLVLPTYTALLNSLYFAFPLVNVQLEVAWKSPYLTAFAPGAPLITARTSGVPTSAPVAWMCMYAGGSSDVSIRPSRCRRSIGAEGGDEGGSMEM